MLIRSSIRAIKKTQTIKHTKYSHEGHESFLFIVAACWPVVGEVNGKNCCPVMLSCLLLVSVFYYLRDDLQCVKGCPPPIHASGSVSSSISSNWTVQDYTQFLTYCLFWCVLVVIALRYFKHKTNTIQNQFQTSNSNSYFNSFVKYLIFLLLYDLYNKSTD